MRLGELVRGWLWGWLVVLVAGGVWAMEPAVSWAAELPTETLTIAHLQDRLQNPVRREGQPTIDLRRVILDLRDDNAEFRNRFYPLLQNRLQMGDTALALDLSESVVRGDFDLQRLSLREPLYGEAFFSPIDGAGAGPVEARSPPLVATQPVIAIAVAAAPVCPPATLPISQPSRFVPNAV